MAAGGTLQGKRYPDLPHHLYTDWHERMGPGGYRRVEEQIGDWRWECAVPSGHLGNLRQHQVVEHDDGTITVFPSILLDHAGTGDTWHGYLERGVWREV